ncbi:MAG: hypothetical protein M3068_02100 [Gemmatimonadota bacterium]|nr:hypothetical protein [Gemmatimonadota bacterium]
MPARPALSLAGPLLVALLAVPACIGAQSRTQEMGSYHYGDAMVWIKATDRGVVELFVARGYRDVFTRASDLTADSLELWADSTEKLASATGPGSAEVVYAGQGLAFGSVALERHLGGATPGLRLESPAIGARLTEPQALELTGTLRAAAQVTQLLTSAAVAIAPALPSPEPRASADLIAAAVSARPSPDAPASAPPITASPAPVAAAPTAVVAPVPAPPVAATPAPSKRAPVTPVAADSGRSNSGGADALPAVFFEDSVLIVRGDVKLPPRSAARAKSLTASSPAAARLLDMQRCYQVAGLSRNPKLGGAVFFLLQIGATGAAEKGEIVGRSWHGAAATATERCLSEKITGWTFPNRAGVGAYQFTASFVP